MPQTGIMKLDLRTGQNAAAAHWEPHDMKAKTLRFPVAFKQPFPSPPLVVLGITALLANSGPILLDFLVEPVEITPVGFNIALGISRTNSVHKLNVTWLALESTSTPPPPMPPATPARSSTSPFDLGSGSPFSPR